MGRAGKSETTDANGLWAMTSYFNPLGYQRRLANYREFRRRLGVPLVTVEWSWTGGEGFQLGPGDADVLVQVQGSDLMWQKERLLNIAVGSLPAECRYVAWLDCDIVFADPDWHGRASEMLGRFAVLHLFDHAYDLASDASVPSGGQPRGSRLMSVVRAEARGDMSSGLARSDQRRGGYIAGFAWAACADVVRRHGFYDACVVGSGDRAIYSAMYGRLDDAMAYIHMTPPWREHYLSWAQPYRDDVQGRIGCVPGCVHHLWHGDIKRRRHAERHLDFELFGFDPATDLMMDDVGCWRWRSDKPRMRRFVESYFASRREDG